jgi:hypothetical protein
MSFRVICTRTTSPAGMGGSVASVALCASASACALSGTTPAKLSIGSAVLWSAWAPLAAGCAAGAGAASVARASRASAHMSRAAIARIPTAIPRNTATTFTRAPESEEGGGR